MQVGKVTSERSLSRDKESSFYRRLRGKLRQYHRRQLIPLICNSAWGRKTLQYFRENPSDDSADIFILSFPKCGRTWLRLLLGKALSLHFGIENVDLLDLKQIGAVCPKVPSISVTHDDRPQWKSPRCLLTAKTEYRGKKIILLARDPRDAMVSNFFQKAQRQRVYEGDISSFLRRKRGGIDTFIRFYNIWAEMRHLPSDFLLVRYEDMQADTRKQLQRVLDFIGLSEVSDCVIKEATEFARFDKMREMEKGDTLKSGRLRPKDINNPESFKARRGKVGGFIDYLSVADIEHLNKKVSEQLSPFYGYNENCLNG